MRKNDIEKSLKRLLKRKIGYSFSLLIAFMITGGVSFATGITAEEIEKNKDDVLAKIQIESEEIKRKIAENEKKIDGFLNESIGLVKKGGYFSKPQWESSFGTGIFDYVKADNQKKEWVYSNDRKYTNNDFMREEYSQSTGNKQGTGWISRDQNWHTNTITYDNKSQLIIVPALKIPMIEEPEEPKINLIIPDVPTISELATVTIGNISKVNVTITPYIPVVPTVPVINIPNFNLDVKEQEINPTIPTIVEIPTVDFFPTINTNIPTIPIETAIIPKFKKQIPILPEVPSIALPNWSPYTRSEVSWLGRNKNWHWFSRFNGAYKNGYVGKGGNMGIHNLFNGSSAYAGAHNVSNTALLETVIPKGGTYVAIPADISYSGKTVTLTDKYGNIISTAGGKALSGWNTVTGDLKNRIGENYIGFIDPYSTGDVSMDGKTFTINNNEAYNQSHYGIFKPLSGLGNDWDPIESYFAADNITVHIGSEKNPEGSILIDAFLYTQPKGLALTNSEINIYGNTLFFGGYTAPRSLKMDLSGTKINIYGNSNTFFHLQDKPSSGSDKGGSINTNGQIEIKMTENLVSNTSKNAILIIETYTTPGTTPNGAENTKTTSGAKHAYAPFHTPLMFENTGNIDMYGAENIVSKLNLAVIKAKPNIGDNPINKITSKITFGGDQNIGIWFAGDSQNFGPNFNAIFAGELDLEFTFGEKLQEDDSKNIQNDKGNITIRPNGTIGDNTKVENSIGLIIESGQRKDLNTEFLYPATARFTNPISGRDPLGIEGIFDKNGNVMTSALIDNVKLDKYKVTFGKHSKDNIAIVAQNGSVIDWTSNITDNSPVVSGTDENSTAQGTTLAYAEGVFWNSRQRGLELPYIQDGIDYASLSQQGGKYYIQEFRTTINIADKAVINSIKSMPFYAKDGGLINTKDIEAKGFGTTVAIVYADKGKADIKTGTENTYNNKGQALSGGKVNWSSEDGYYGPTVTDSDGNILTYSSVLPTTEINIDGNIEALVQGPRRDENGLIISNELVNDNTGAMAKVKDGENGAKIAVSGNLKVNGLGALVDGTGALITIKGSNSEIKTGKYGAFVATNNGKIEFGGGTIEHKETYIGSHDSSSIFYAETGGSISFNGDTVINTYDGYPFVGNKDDYSVTTTITGVETGKYLNMGNVTINLMEDGIILGVKENAGVILWTGMNEDEYLTEIKDDYKLKDLNSNGYKWLSIIAGSTLQVQANSNIILDSQTDAFNNLILQRSKLVLDHGATISSITGLGVVIGSAKEANVSEGGTGNSETGFDINGKINISGGTESKQAIAIYTSYGQIKLGTTGEISVDNGIGAYGVNGTEIENKGKITITGSGMAIAGVAHKIDGNGAPSNSNEDYGTDAGEIGNLLTIKNQGNIEIGSNSIGIYAENNMNLPKARATVDNSGKIKTGDNSVGIMLKGTLNTTISGVADGITATITGMGIGDIEIGKDSIGIHAEKSDVTLNSNYGIELKDGSVGIYVKESILNTMGNLDIKYTGSVTGTGIGILYENSLGTTTSNMNIEVNNSTNTTDVVSAIYYKNGTGILNNIGNISSSNGKFYGIISENSSVMNTGIITLDQVSGVGIYAKDPAFIMGGIQKIETDASKLQITGDNSIGISMETTSSNDKNGNIKTDVLEITGTTPLIVNGKNSIGAMVANTSGTGANSELKISNGINLIASTNDSERKIGVLQTGDVGINITGIIDVNSNNIGLYVENANNAYTISNINISGNDSGSIGLYSKENDITNIIGAINLSGMSQNISVLVKSDGSIVREVSGISTINVETTSMNEGDNNIGILVKGNKIEAKISSPSTWNVDSNSMGMYFDGDSTTKLTGTSGIVSKIELESHISGRIGLGSYFTGGAYADSTVTFEIKSDGTVKDLTGNIIKPVGVYYGVDSTKNESTININSTTWETSVIGLYGNNLTSFENSGKIEIVAGTENIGTYFKKSNVENSGEIKISGIKNIGMFISEGNLSLTGNLTLNATESIGVIAKGNKTIFTNKNNNMIISGQDSAGISALEGAKVSSTGNIQISNKAYVGIAKDQGSVFDLISGTIRGTGNDLTALIAKDSGKVILSGGDIILNNQSVGIYNENAIVEIRAGKIELGEDSVGIYAKNGDIELTGSTAEIIMKNNSIAIRVEDGIVSGNNALNVNYTGMLNKGIGLYYKNSNTTTNSVEVNHTGDNLINIYSDSTNLINIANQSVQKDGIGIYSNAGTLVNEAEINLIGNNTAGIYLAGGATISKIGKITGNYSPTSGGGKVGIYVNGGDIVGNSLYDFSLSGGIGIYLENSTISYSGTLALSGDSTQLNRTIGIYIAPPVSGTLGTNLSITGKNTIGLYLAKDSLTSSAANITYNGKLDIISQSTTDLGVGVYLENGTIFTLGSNGKINIGGTNNVGFYVKNGAIFNVSGGTITNTKDGIFAYLDGGTINFISGSTLDINYANIITENSGNITNDMILTVGTIGLQGVKGSSITNSVTGILTGNITEGKAMVGDGIGTIINNNGQIILTGNSSVGIYVSNGAIGNSVGSVTVVNNSIAYYAGKDSTLNISGMTTLGNESVLLYADGGQINYTGSNNLVTSGNKNIGILLTKSATTVGGYSVNLNGKDIIVGVEGTGILIKDTGTVSEIKNLGKLIVGTKGVGVYSDNNNNISLGNNIELLGENAVGILMNKNGSIDYSGNLTSTNSAGKGLVSLGTGSLTNQKNIKLLGESSIGIYGKTSSSITNKITGIIEVGNGTTTSSSVGIYGENIGSILNDGIIKFSKYAVGIYGKKGNITNTGTIIGSTDKGTGIYAVESSVNNVGDITIGDSSNGIFVKNGSAITNTGNITVGSTNSSGIYGTGMTSVSHNGGSIITGNNSVGIATNLGNIVVSSGALIISGKESTHIYTVGGTVTNNADMQLNDFSVGMYAVSGTLKNNAKISLGKSDKTTTPVKISVGMATETGRMENLGIIKAQHDNGVGMLANNGGIGINIGTIDLIGKEAYGMQGMNAATLENRGTINVDGVNSKGIVAINKTMVKNIGTINVNGSGAQGIYVETGSKVDNTGTITVNGSGKTGIYIGDGGNILNTGTIVLNGGGTTVIEGSGSIKNIGDIIINGPSASIDGVTIDNTGTIEIPGILDFDTIKISGNGLNEHVGTINAETFKEGEFLILSDVTQGSNHDMYVVQYLGTKNEPNTGEISAISQSVSFIADIQKDPTDGNKFNIVLVKIPYEKMLKQTAAENFGEGLDDLYTGANGKELEIFDLLDKMSNKDELISTFENELRGNEYANIQDRMLDIENVFDNSYNKLKHEKLYTKESLKIGAIVRKSESEYKNASLNDYEVNTIGAIVLKEYDHLTYERKSNIHLGLVQSKFDFIDRGSSEEVYSLNIGIGYEDYINVENSLKWHLNGDILINHHEMDRKLNISGSEFSNEGKYWSGTAMIKNKIRYEVLQNNEKIDRGFFGTFNLGYGKFGKFGEEGDGVELELQSNDMYIVRPGIGTDITLNKYTENGKVSLKGKLTAEYELGEVYDGANKAKIKNSSAQYYSLDKPKKLKEIINIGAEVKYETREGHSISFDIVRELERRDSLKYGINLMYKF